MNARRILALVLAGLLVGVSGARADDWHSEQPPPPDGTAVGAPVPLGPVGDIEFWAPNRGLLTTAGNDGVPAGLYAYDGTGWYELSTVCGGHDGRIAWAGPDEWWTIGDQPTGPAASQGPFDQTLHVSLCHFVGGQVVASYAEPLGVPQSYLPMNAAACSSPSDCWFAGNRLPGTTNAGAFHLHWDGTSLTAIPSLTQLQPEVVDPARTVAGLAFNAGHLYESVKVQQDDSATDTYLLHEILEDGSSNPFLGLFSDQPINAGPVSPWDLAPLHLASGDGPLWAVAGAVQRGSAAKVTVLRADGEDVTQLVLQDPGGVLAPGTAIDGAAAESGSGAVWVSFVAPSDSTNSPARLTRIHADGTVDPALTLPSATDGIARRGAAGPIACPAPGQCWMATAQGWLFHLGSSLPQDADPSFHRLITFRPPDDSVPFVPPDSIPIDDSGANPPSDQIQPPSDDSPLPPKPHKVRPLASGIRQRLVHLTLELSFTLRARAHVQLVAERRRHVVARTRRVTLAAGRHLLRLKLNPHRWPTKLDLRVSAAPSKSKAKARR